MATAKYYIDFLIEYYNGTYAERCRRRAVKRSKVNLDPAIFACISSMIKIFNKNDLAILKILNKQAKPVEVRNVVHRPYQTDRYVNGLLHSINGKPAKIKNGNKFWLKHGLLHREDGPAIEWANGLLEWWNEGTYICESRGNTRIFYPVTTVFPSAIWYDTVLNYQNNYIQSSQRPIVYPTIFYPLRFDLNCIGEMERCCILGRGYWRNELFKELLSMGTLCANCKPTDAIMFREKLKKEKQDYKKLRRTMFGRKSDKKRNDRLYTNVEKNINHRSKVVKY